MVAGPVVAARCADLRGTTIISAGVMVSATIERCGIKLRLMFPVQTYARRQSQYCDASVASLVKKRKGSCEIRSRARCVRVSSAFRELRIVASAKPYRWRRWRNRGCSGGVQCNDGIRQIHQDACD